MSRAAEPLPFGTAEPAPAAADLPLSPLERFLRVCHDSGQPMVFRVFVRFKGEADAPRLMAAYTQASERQPLLRSHIAGLGSAAVWQVCEPSLTPTWGSDGADPELYRRDFEPLPPASQCGVRTHMDPCEGGLFFRLDFQHVCCDGQGARQFILDWMRIYDRTIRGRELSLIRLDPARLGLRSVIAAAAVQPRVGFLEGLRNFYVTVRGRTARVPRISRPARARDPRPPLLAQRIFSEDATARVRKALKQWSVTINDLGLAASFVAFNSQFPETPGRHFITVANPVDRRGIADLRLPAANRWGLVFLRRRMRDCTSIAELLQGLHDEMQYIKAHNVADEFLRAVGFAARWRGDFLLHRLVRWFAPTLQFTCLGDPTRTVHQDYAEAEGARLMGALQYDTVTGFAPVGPGVPVSICICESFRRMTISLVGNDRFVTPEVVDRLADRLERIVADWSATAPAAQTS